jgi:hypothetical protein
VQVPARRARGQAVTGPAAAQPASAAPATVEAPAGSHASDRHTGSASSGGSGSSGSDATSDDATSQTCSRSGAVACCHACATGGGGGNGGGAVSSGGPGADSTHPRAVPHGAALRPSAIAPAAPPPLPPLDATAHPARLEQLGASLRAAAAQLSEPALAAVDQQVRGDARTPGALAGCPFSGRLLSWLECSQAHARTPHVPFQRRTLAPRRSCAGPAASSRPGERTSCSRSCGGRA